MYLYETHLPVANTEASTTFYTQIVGLEFAYRDPARDLHRGHFAIAISLPQLLAIGQRLNDLGVPTRDFAGAETTEPSVIGWMPSAQLYFRDPDGHSVEFISLLDDPPDPSFIGPLSEWQRSR